MSLFILIVLGVLLGISFVTDIASRRILNVVTFPAMLIGLVYHTATTGLEGILFSGAGFLVGLAVLFIPFVLGGMGAGDVKLLAAVGALAGTSFVLSTFILGAFTGGILALIMIFKKHGSFSSVKSVFYALSFLRGGGISDLRKTAKKTTMPYGVAITLGAVFAYIGGFGV
jgi:prepilin peptidase CpaA